MGRAAKVKNEKCIHRLSWAKLKIQHYYCFSFISPFFSAEKRENPFYLSFDFTHFTIQSICVGATLFNWAWFREGDSYSPKYAKSFHYCFLSNRDHLPTSLHVNAPFEWFRRMKRLPIDNLTKRNKFSLLTLTRRRGLKSNEKWVKEKKTTMKKCILRKKKSGKWKMKNYYRRRKSSQISSANSRTTVKQKRRQAISLEKWDGTKREN